MAEPKFEKRHLVKVAEIIRGLHTAGIVDDEQHARIAFYFSKSLAGTNDRFDNKKFVGRALSSQKTTTAQPQKAAQPA